LIIASHSVWTNHPERGRGEAYVTHYCSHNSALRNILPRYADRRTFNVAKKSSSTVDLC